VLSPPSAPPRSLRRAPWRAAPFAALDFETTGLDYRRDAVVAFGVVPVRRGRVVVGEGIHRLVDAGVASSPASMKVHQLLPRDLATGLAPDEAGRELRTALEGRFLLTWYADVEVAFLRRTFGGRARTWTRRMVDVRRLAIELEGADPQARFGLSACANRYGVPVASPHEAFDDALVTAQLFLVLASKLEDRGIRSVRGLLRLTRLHGRG
jgi:DNA polymerase-3 subunit epsilon